MEGGATEEVKKFGQVVVKFYKKGCVISSIVGYTMNNRDGWGLILGWESLVHCGGWE